MDAGTGKWQQPARAAVKYVLLQIPGWVLVGVVLILIRSWWPFPSWIAWAIWVVWFLKDLAMFPLVWRAYATGEEDGHSPMVGLKGVVVKELNPGGVVRVRGELWQARLIQEGAPAAPGATVRIRDRQGLMLLVEREYPRKAENLSS